MSSEGAAVSDAEGEASHARQRDPILIAMVGLESGTEALVVEACQRSRAGRSPRTEPPGVVAYDDGSPDLESFTDLRAARDAIARDDRARVVLVIDASELRKKRTFPADVHVVAIVGPDRTAAEGIEADDILRRPFDIDDLRVRLQMGMKRLARETTVFGVVRDSMRTKKSGDVIVSLGADSARVHLNEGKLVWVHNSQRPLSIRALLAELDVELDEETCREVLEESRATRRHFADVLVEWGLIDAELLRAGLRDYLGRELYHLLGQSEAHVAFVQEQRPFASTFAFSGDSILRGFSHRRIVTRHDMPAVRIDEPSVSRAAVEQWLRRTLAIPNVLRCALVDPKAGALMGSDGFDEAVEQGLLWSLVASFAALGDGAEEVVASNKTGTYLVRAAPAQFPALMVVAFDASQMSPAMARILLTRST